jgi:hypothetical protein
LTRRARQLARRLDTGLTARIEKTKYEDAP